MTILVIHHTLGVTWINIAPKSISNPYDYAQGQAPLYPSGRPEQPQQRGHLFVDRRQVPLDDQMVVEAKISPRDVAFIHPGQKALVKITAYDYSIYGGLEGEVTMISPDTLQDEVKRDVYYYRVYIRTDSNHLTNKQGQEFPVFPGMIATVDIKTGSKTILDYLLKPLNKAKEALRER